MLLLNISLISERRVPMGDKYLLKSLEIYESTVRTYRLRRDPLGRVGIVFLPFILLVSILFRLRRIDVPCNFALIFTKNQKKIADYLSIPYVELISSYIYILKLIRVKDCLSTFSFLLVHREYRYLWLKIVRAFAENNYVGRLIEDKNISDVLFLNDHAVSARYIAYKLKAAGIKINYLQHANVTPSFPPLDIWSRAFLFSKDALNIYESIGIRPQVETRLGYDLRLLIVNLEERETFYDVVIFLNELDSLVKAKWLYGELSHKYKVAIKMHPADKRKLRGVQLVDGNVLSLASQAKHCLVGGSSVLIECMSQNRNVLECSDLLRLEDAYMKNNSQSVYSFKENGLIVKDIEKISDMFVNDDLLSTNCDYSRLKLYTGDISVKSSFCDEIRDLF